MATLLEYVSEDGVVHQTEAEAIAYRLVYRTRIVPPDRTADEMRPRSRKSKEQEEPQPSKDARRDWADRINPKSPMTTDPDLEAKAKEQ